MSGTYTPRPEWLNLDWHHATNLAGQVCVQRCDDCGRWRHPPRRFCPQCFSRAASFQPVSGAGIVVSFAVSHRSLDPGWAARAPFPTLVVGLDEGPRLVAATSLAPEDVRIGLRVRLVAETVTEDFALVWVEPTQPG